MRLFFKNLLFTIVAPGTVAGLVPRLITRDRSLSLSPETLVPGVVFLLCGLAIYGWCVWDFATFGRGTPAPIDAPKKLVVRGLYRTMRNPMYVGVLSVVLSWAWFFHALAVVLYAAGVWTAFHLFVVFYEEPHLQRLFGESYIDYRGRVRRWLPGLNRS